VGKLKQKDREKEPSGPDDGDLLKRLDKFRRFLPLTLRRLASNHHHTLAKIEAFKTPGATPPLPMSPRRLRTPSPTKTRISRSRGRQYRRQSPNRLSDMDLPSWEHDLRTDLTVIDALLAEMDKITQMTTPSSSTSKPKRQKLANPINPGNRKILLFTAFADTAAYLYEHLARASWPPTKSIPASLPVAMAQNPRYPAFRLPVPAHAVLPALERKSRRPTQRTRRD